MASAHPEIAVYSGPKPPTPRAVTLRTLRAKYERGDPITMVTAYDYPSAVHVGGPELQAPNIREHTSSSSSSQDVTLSRVDEDVYNSAVAVNHAMCSTSECMRCAWPYPQRAATAAQTQLRQPQSRYEAPLLGGYTSQ